jgi:hypothetical protein
MEQGLNEREFGSQTPPGLPKASGKGRHTLFCSYTLRYQFDSARVHPALIDGFPLLM